MDISSWPVKYTKHVIHGPLLCMFVSQFDRLSVYLLPLNLSEAGGISTGRTGGIVVLVPGLSEIVPVPILKIHRPWVKIFPKCFSYLCYF